MKVLGLDLSLHCGWAVIENGKRVESGTIDHDRCEWISKGCVEDYNLIATAQSIGQTAAILAIAHEPDFIYIEQTNGSAFRDSQKLLEFIHYAVLNRVLPSKVRYIDTSRWRSVLGIKMNKEQKAHNKAVKAKTAKGKITTKHLAVQWVNRMFGLELLLKDNNEADALAVAYAGYLELQKPKAPEAPDIDKAFKP